jgi:23S rRNA (pseudouridine1915-N3)-methyltransferase
VFSGASSTPQDSIASNRSIRAAMHLIAIGKLGNSPEGMLFERYNTRVRPRLVVVELSEEQGPPLVIKRKEGAALLDALPKAAFVVALDLGGTEVTSEAFATCLRQWSGLSRTICFLIGGAEGLDASVIARADYLLSFGTMTYPHMLIRVMLAEQLYRANTILAGHPYHRAGRPSARLSSR